MEFEPSRLIDRIGHRYRIYRISRALAAAMRGVQPMLPPQAEPRDMDIGRGMVPAAAPEVVTPEVPEEDPHIIFLDPGYPRGALSDAPQSLIIMPK